MTRSPRPRPGRCAGIWLQRQLEEVRRLPLGKVDGAPKCCLRGDSDAWSSTRHNCTVPALQPGIHRRREAEAGSQLVESLVGRRNIRSALHGCTCSHAGQRKAASRASDAARPSRLPKTTPVSTASMVAGQLVIAEYTSGEYVQRTFVTSARRACRIRRTGQASSGGSPARTLQLNFRDERRHQ